MDLFCNQHRIQVPRNLSKRYKEYILENQRTFLVVLLLLSSLAFWLSLHPNKKQILRKFR